MTQQTDVDVEPIAERLAQEIWDLNRQVEGRPVAMLMLKALEAYTLIAMLQGTSRHPGLSETQRGMALGFAHQLADQMAGLARERFGEPNAIETTLAMGFDEQFDVPIGREGAATADELDLEDLAAEIAEEADGSHVLGERRCRYVEPTFLVTGEAESEMDLLQCALCARFFLQDAPIRLFQELGDQVVLGFAVCDPCAPKVLARMGREGR